MVVDDNVRQLVVPVGRVVGGTFSTFQQPPCLNEACPPSWFLEHLLIITASTRTQPANQYKIVMPHTAVKATGTKNIVVRNLGTRTASASLSCEPAGTFSINPAQVVVPVGTSSQLELAFNPERSIRLETWKYGLAGAGVRC